MSAFDPNCTVTIYRAKTMQLVWGPVNGFIIPYISGRLMRPEEMPWQSAEVSRDADSTTHIISFDITTQDQFTPMLEDYVHVQNSNIFDGYFVMKQYPRAYQQGDPDDDHWECLSRYLGPKKPGDTQPDSSGNIRLGGHKL